MSAILPSVEEFYSLGPIQHLLPNFRATDSHKARGICTRPNYFLIWVLLNWMNILLPFHNLFDNTLLLLRFYEPLTFLFSLFLWRIILRTILITIHTVLPLHILPILPIVPLALIRRQNVFSMPTGNEIRRVLGVGRLVDWHRGSLQLIVGAFCDLSLVLITLLLDTDPVPPILLALTLSLSRLILNIRVVLLKLTTISFLKRCLL